MPSKAQKAALLAAAAKGHNAIAEAHIALSTESPADLWARLQAAEHLSQELELELAQANSKLLVSEERNAELLKRINFFESKQATIQHDLRMETQQLKRSCAKEAKLDAQITLLTSAAVLSEAGLKESQDAIGLLQKEKDGVESELSRSISGLSAELKKSRSEHDTSAKRQVCL